MIVYVVALLWIRAKSLKRLVSYGVRKAVYSALVSMWSNVGDFSVTSLKGSYAQLCTGAYRRCSRGYPPGSALDSLHEYMQIVVELTVLGAKFGDGAASVQDGGVVAAAEGIADLRQTVRGQFAR